MKGHKDQHRNMNHEEKQDDLTKNLNNLDTRICYTLLALKGILLVATIVLISSTDEMSKVKPCDLQKVLVSLSVDSTFLCKYDDIKKKSTTICHWGISFVVLNAISFLLILNFMWIPLNTNNGIYIRLVGTIAIALVAVLYSAVMLYYYKGVLDFKENHTDTNYAQIKSAMIARLEANYTSDNVTSGDVISDSWNKFFIKYECCAVNQVQGTTNDFDSTPWCITLGSCQATASQIPKTCCNYVSEDDYGNAPTACHSSVSPGTYKPNCMIPIKTLSTINIEECQISRLLISLLIIGTLEIAEFLIEAMLMLVNICCWEKTKIEPKKKETAIEMDTKEKEK